MSSGNQRVDQDQTCPDRGKPRLSGTSQNAPGAHIKLSPINRGRSRTWDEGGRCRNAVNADPRMAEARPSFESVVMVAGRANPVEAVADLRGGFQVMGFGGAVGLVGCLRKLLNVAVPVRIARPLRDD